MPFLVVGSPSAERDGIAQALEVFLDRPARMVDLAAVEKSFTRRDTVGVVVVVPEARDLHQAGLEEQVTRIRAADRSVPLVLAARQLDGPAAIAAFRAGFQDVLIVGENEGGLSAPPSLAGWIEQRSSTAAGSLFGSRPGMPRFLGAAPTMRDTVRLIERVAPSDATVLILGESGTGKELVARAVHELSPRRRGPFVAINCAAIPETLLENELFGHEKGSYTGASSTAIGKVEAAEKGTLFLDEIGEMPVSLQAKILRLLQEKTYDRIGGMSLRRADIRIVTATNRELKQEVEAGRFREDLYYRLSVVPISLPSLRERREDIPLIARDIVARLAQRLERPGLRLDESAIERLVAHRWPGNVRELENEIERAAVMSNGDTIGAGDLELKVRVEDPERIAMARLVPLGGPLEEVRQLAAECAARIRISIALEEADGDRERAAAALGISVEDLSEYLAEAAGN